MLHSKQPPVARKFSRPCLSNFILRVTATSLQHFYVGKTVGQSVLTDERHSSTHVLHIIANVLVASHNWIVLKKSINTNF